ncbi:transposase [Legionella fallonii]
MRQVAKELGVTENNLYNWRKQLHKKQKKAFPNQSQFKEY